MASRVVWVTGASSGLGQSLAAALQNAGWLVVGGARSFPGSEGEGDKGHRLFLDVTDQKSIETFREKAYALAGAPDALVNAAALITLGPAESVAIGELQAVLDAGFLGAVRMAQAVLPMMRKKGSGLIVCISSLNGLMPTPYQGAYVAAKHALEGFFECLMMETQKENIQVMLVEPGDHRGGSKKYRAHAENIPENSRESFERGIAVIARDEAHGSDPNIFARKVARVMGKKKLPFRLRVATPKEYFALVMHDILPGRLYLDMLAQHYRI